MVAVRETSTVEEAVQHIRKTVTEERPFGVYAVDDHQHLIGRVPLRRLLLADPRSLILGILEDEEVVSVNAKMDREEMARVVAKYDLVTVPVVDDQNRLVGTITVDDVIDVVQEEASEDIFRMAGSDARRARAPVTRPGGDAPPALGSPDASDRDARGVVIHYFDRTLGKVILLASFMPVIQAISGNTGLQSVTMVVRGLATGQVQLSRWWEPLWRQIQTSAILGAVCAVVVGLDRLPVALPHVRTGGRHLHVRLGQPVGMRGDGHPHAVEAHGLRPGPDRRTLRNCLPGRPRRHDLPLSGHCPAPLVSLVVTDT